MCKDSTKIVSNLKNEMHEEQGNKHAHNTPKSNVSVHYTFSFSFMRLMELHDISNPLHDMD
jgi:hypothetical protein